MKKTKSLGMMAAGLAAALLLFGAPGIVHAADAPSAQNVPAAAGLKKTAMPGAYPMPGTYEISFSHVRLGSATPNAVIHYTLDGSELTEKSPVFDPKKGAIPLLEFNSWADNKDKQEKTVVVKAMAESKGAAPSDTATMTYDFIMNKPGYFSYEVLREGKTDTPALIRITDYDRVNMYLVVGSKRALLIDSGMDTKGDLYSLIEKLTGGLPFDAISLHGHADHTRQTQNFLDKNVKVYVPKSDLSWFGDTIPKNTLDPKEGQTFDLGIPSLPPMPSRDTRSAAWSSSMKRQETSTPPTLWAATIPSARTPVFLTTWASNAPWTATTQPSWTSGRN